MFARRLILTIACAVICAAAFNQASAQLDAGKLPQLICGSSKAASGASIDGDDITYFATINNITGPFSVHLYMKRIDCSPSCDPSVFSIFAADGKVRQSTRVALPFDPLMHVCAGLAQGAPVPAQRRPINHDGCHA
jgi:hypothetical protein